MADSDKDIVITPNKGQTTEPVIEFTGADNTPLTLRVLDDGTVTFEGTAGQLFSVSDGYTGTLFSVNDISGIPSIEVLDSGEVRIAVTNGFVTTSTINPGATNSYDLGNTGARWRNIYTQDLHLSNGIGDYTIIEGEEDLFLVNNKTGKSFKFVLSEVDPSEVPERSETD